VEEVIRIGIDGYGSRFSNIDAVNLGLREREQEWVQVSGVRNKPPILKPEH
jgi:hypothetical protein